MKQLIYIYIYLFFHRKKFTMYNEKWMKKFASYLHVLKYIIENAKFNNVIVLITLFFK